MPKGHILDARMARVQRNMLNIQSVLLSRKISGLFPNTVNLFNKRTSQESVGRRNWDSTTDAFGIEMLWRWAWAMAQRLKGTYSCSRGHSFSSQYLQDVYNSKVRESNVIFLPLWEWDMPWCPCLRIRVDKILIFYIKQKSFLNAIERGKR